MIFFTIQTLEKLQNGEYSPSRPTLPRPDSIQTKTTNLAMALDVLTSYSVSSKSVERFRLRSRKYEKITLDDDGRRTDE